MAEMSELIAEIKALKAKVKALEDGGESTKGIGERIDKLEKMLSDLKDANFDSWE